MLRAIDVVRRLAPRARPAYVRAFEEGDALLVEYGVTTPLRLAHFLAQIFHESDGLSLERESGAYSAGRLVEVFGRGHHSAGITPGEAERLAGDGPAIFERVYGLGNPKMARELGNTQPGDGFCYRGNGLMQTTGRENHRRMGQKCGLGDLFERDPSAVTAAAHALKPALAEWRESRCNALADAGDIERISKAINLGNPNSGATPNGLKDRKAWFGKIYPLLKKEGVAFNPQPAAAKPSADASPAAQPARPPAVPEKPTTIPAAQAGGAVVAGGVGAASAHVAGLPWWAIALIFGGVVLAGLAIAFTVRKRRG